MSEKHWCVSFCLYSISCSVFKPFQSGIWPSHSAENAIENTTDFLMAKFGGFFFFLSLSYVTSLQHLTAFASVTLWKLCSLTYVTIPSSHLLLRLLFCLLLGLFFFSCYTPTDYCRTVLWMFHDFNYILLNSKSLFPGLIDLMVH